MSQKSIDTHSFMRHNLSIYSKQLMGKFTNLERFSEESVNIGVKSIILLYLRYARVGTYLPSVFPGSVFCTPSCKRANTVRNLSNFNTWDP